MKRFLIICTLGFLLVTHCMAQIIPKDGDTVNYRLAGFSVPVNKKADNYLLEIAKGNIKDESRFNQNIVLKKESSNNQIIGLLPFFKTSYTWRICFQKQNKIIGKTAFYHLTTGYIPFLDTQRYRVRIVNSSISDSNLFMFYDNTRTLRDIHGDAVWYIPDIPGVLDSSMSVRDLKISPTGTITFLTAKNAYEINYEGKVLWFAPDDGKISNDISEFYHHEFTKLLNGHYMVAGNEYLHMGSPLNDDTIKYKNDRGTTNKDGKRYRSVVEVGTLIEYDSAKKITWSWRSSKYLGNNDFFKVNPAGKISFSSHLNSFFFDEKNNLIYVGFRDISRIVKINYPEGDYINSYGQSSEDQKRQGDGWFYGQHNVKIESGGNLLLFNNNVSPHRKLLYSQSTILILKEPKTRGESLEKVWEFSCSIDTLTFPYSPSGGSVFELADRSILTCMGGTNRVFIVDRNKKVLWNALCEWKNPNINNPGWVWEAGYRVSAIETRRQLQAIIFN